MTRLATMFGRWILASLMLGMMGCGGLEGGSGACVLPASGACTNETEFDCATQQGEFHDGKSCGDFGTRAPKQNASE